MDGKPLSSLNLIRGDRGLAVRGMADSSEGLIPPGGMVIPPGAIVPFPTHGHERRGTVEEPASDLDAAEETTYAPASSGAQPEIEAVRQAQADFSHLSAEDVVATPEWPSWPGIFLAHDESGEDGTATLLVTTPGGIRLHVEGWEPNRAHCLRIPLKKPVDDDLLLAIKQLVGRRFRADVTEEKKSGSLVILGLADEAVPAVVDQVALLTAADWDPDAIPSLTVTLSDQTGVRGA